MGKTREEGESYCGNKGKGVDSAMMRMEGRKINAFEQESNPC